MQFAVPHLVLPAAGGKCLFVFFLKLPGTARGMPVRPGDSGKVGSYQSVVIGYTSLFLVLPNRNYERFK